MDEEQKPEASTEEKKEQENNNQSVDYYKQELEKVNAEKAKAEEARIKAENAIIDFKRKKKAEVEDLEDEEPKEDIKELIKSEISSIRIDILKETRAERANIIAQTISSNQDEKALILHHYQNSIIPTGNLEEDMRKAKAIANASKYEAEIAERNRALQANANKGGNDSGAGNPTSSEPPAPKLTTKERQFIGSDLGKGVVVKDGKFVSSAKEKFLKKRGLA